METSAHIGLPNYDTNETYYANYPPLALQQWATLEVAQSKTNNGKYAVKVSINGEVQSTRDSSTAYEYEDVRVYNAGPQSVHPPAAALTRNLEIHTNPDI